MGIIVMNEAIVASCSVNKNQLHHCKTYGHDRAFSDIRGPCRVKFTKAIKIITAAINKINVSVANTCHSEPLTAVMQKNVRKN
ncbi:hypothetical protein CLV51_10778 [Chitinophaga niastensis]|uniref:Uncharacterized protein n=1 Tax=Chitinophaga niastensis TaxID=536980 RepID=A0A2P8HC17_CHINA|nr:hypothetical protein CLV51_10778 [Chitinophaga niastensis]